jgi:transposase
MRTRRRFTAEFKAKVALEAIQGQRTIADLAARYELHPNLIMQWKRQAIEKLAKVFDDKGLEVQASRDAEVTRLHAKIGQLVVESLLRNGVWVVVTFQRRRAAAARFWVDVRRLG